MKTFFGKFLAMLNIKNNFAMKVISLVSAIFFWIFVMDTENPVVTRTFYNVPIVYAGEADPGLVISNAPTYYSNIEISGRRNSVLASRSESFVLKVNLSGLKDGSNEAEIEYSTHLNDINIDRVSPNSVVVTLEKVIRVEKPVYYNKISNFDSSLSRSELTIEPTKMMVTGPRSLVAGVSSVIANIDVSEIEGSSQIEIPLFPVNSLGEKVEDVTLEKESALITVHAVREKEVPFIYEYHDNSDENHNLTRFIISANTVKIIGDPSVVDAISSLKADPIVVTGPEDASGNVEFEPIEGVTFLNAEGIRYQAEFAEIIEKNLRLTSNDFKYELLSDGFVAKVDSSSELIIVVRGLKETVDMIKTSDFGVKLDLNQLEEGEHMIAPTVEYLGREQITYKVLTDTPIKVVITDQAEE